MERSRFSFTAEVWEHEGPAAWHFASVPESVVDEIEADASEARTSSR